MYRLKSLFFFVFALLVASAAPVFAHELSGPAEFAARVVGAASFANIIWVLSIGLAAACILVLLKEWLWYLVTLLPIEVYEVLCYLVSIGFIVDAFANTITTAENAAFVALTGCVFTGMSLLFSFHIHNISMKPANYFGIMTPVFGITAVLFASSMMGKIPHAYCRPLAHILGYKKQKRRI